MPTRTCDHTFRDTSNCTKCNVHVSVLKLEGRVEAMELTLSILTEAPAPISGHTLFTRLVDVEKNLQRVLSLAAWAKFSELGNEIERVSTVEEAARVHRTPRSRWSDLRNLLNDVAMALQHEARVLQGLDERNATVDGARIDLLYVRCVTMARGLEP